MLAFRIALRYLFSRKSHGAVNLISAVAVAAVAVASAAMIIVLSVFNGFARLCEAKLSKFDAPVLVVPASGKVFAGADSLAATLGQLPQTGAAVPVLTEQAFAIAGQRQMAVTLMGVGQGWTSHCGITDIVIDGTPRVATLPNGWSGAMLSAGAAMALQTTPRSPWTVSIFQPRRQGRYNPANPTSAFRSDTIACMGVFRVEQEEYDRDMIVVPIEMSRRLLDYNDSQATGIAVWPRQGVAETDLRQAVDKAIAAQTDLKTLDRLQQQPDIFRMIAVEKWITFVMLAFIMAIAAFNIVSTLSMMVLEKQPNMGVMRAMGATDSLISRVFACQGWLITMAGSAAGVLAGSLLSAAQQHFGWVKLSAGDPSLLSTDVYPVALEAADAVTVLAVAAATALATALVGAMLPRRKTGRHDAL